MPRVYLDHNATSPPSPAARAALRAVLDRVWANPHSPHAEGQAARGALEEARAAVAGLAGVPPAAVVFTSGGSEAAHAALQGAARAAGGGRVVISALEHASILAAADALERDGFTVVRVPPDASGVTDAERFLEACAPSTAVAALMVAHNEIGTLQPVDEVAGELGRRGIPLVADAVQAPGRLPAILPPGEHIIGLLSGHKLGGFAGAGALIADPALALVPLLGGGAQERGRRGGTPATALAAAMGAAAAERAREGAAYAPAMAALRDRFEAGLRAVVEDVEVMGEGRPRLPNTSAFLMPGVAGEDVVASLDLEGVAVSTGSACSTGAGRPSAALRAMGLPPERAAGMVRMSLGPDTRVDDVEFALDALRRVAPRLRRHAPAGRVR